LSEEVPETYRNVVEKALEKSPAERYQSMREMVVDLRRGQRSQRLPAPVEGGVPSSGHLAELPAAPPKPGRRPLYYGLAILGAVIVVVGMLALWTTIPHPQRAPKVVSFKKLTNDGQAKLGPMATDGTRIYFTVDPDFPSRTMTSSRKTKTLRIRLFVSRSGSPMVSFLGTESCSRAAPQQVDCLVEDLVRKAPTVIAAFWLKYRCVRVKLGMLLLVCLQFASPRTSSHAQAQQPIPLEFTNSTAAAGIKFIHFKGNSGTSINREEFGPGVCVAVTREREHASMSKRSAF
jgi:hypothetical protein